MANLMLNDAARVALAVLFNSLWQGALIALVAWGVLRIFSRANAATRYAIWALALAAMIVIPIFTSLPHVSVEASAAHTAWMPPASMSSNALASGPVQAPATHHDVVRSAPFPLNFSVPQFRIPTAVALAVFVVWGLAALVVLGRLIFAIVSLEKLKRDSLPLDVAYRDQMPEWSAAIKGFRDVRICVSDAIEVPVAIGLFDAMILLPRAARRIARSQRDRPNRAARARSSASQRRLDERTPAHRVQPHVFQPGSVVRLASTRPRTGSRM